MDDGRLNILWVKKQPSENISVFMRNLDGGEGLPLHHHCVALVLLRRHQASKPDKHSDDDDADVDHAHN